MLPRYQNRAPDPRLSRLGLAQVLVSLYVVTIALSPAAESAQAARDPRNPGSESSPTPTPKPPGLHTPRRNENALLAPYYRQHKDDYEYISTRIPNGLTEANRMRSPSEASAIPSEMERIFDELFENEEKAFQERMEENDRRYDERIKEIEEEFSERAHSDKTVAKPSEEKLDAFREAKEALQELAGVPSFGDMVSSNSDPLKVVDNTDLSSENALAVAGKRLLDETKDMLWGTAENIADRLAAGSPANHKLVADSLDEYVSGRVNQFEGDVREGLVNGTKDAITTALYGAPYEELGWYDKMSYLMTHEIWQNISVEGLLGGKPIVEFWDKVPGSAIDQLDQDLRDQP